MVSTPPKPQRPDPNECCGSGCVPCVYDYYYDQLADWEEKYGAQNDSSNQTETVSVSAQEPG